jgi:site-specific recombinase XerD
MQTAFSSDVKFLLKNPRAVERTLISLVYRYNNQRFVYSTGQFIEPYQWDAVNQRAYTNQKIKIVRQTHESINAHLERHRAALIQVVAALRLADVPIGNPTIKQYVDKALQKEREVKDKPAPVLNFLDYITKFVEDARAGKRLNAKNSRFADGTLVNYIKIRNILTAYQTYRRHVLTNQSFTLDFYYQFKTYLVSKGHTLNYVGSVLSGTKILLKQAARDGLPVGTEFLKKEFRKIEEEVDNIYLNDADLQTLYDLDLSCNNRLDRVRDVFLIGCYTGLRFTNYSYLRSENILPGGRLLSVRAIKNGPKVTIPLNLNVVAILNKYNGELPRALTNQKFNQYIKELGERAGLTRPVEKTRTEGGKRTTQTAQLYELITSHTAQRSFATNAFLAGVPTVSIMKITGHKSEGQFLKYIKISSEQNAMLMLEHPHFSGIDPKQVVRPLHKAA